MTVIYQTFSKVKNLDFKPFVTVVTVLPKKSYRRIKNLSKESLRKEGHDRHLDFHLMEALHARKIR